MLVKITLDYSFTEKVHAQAASSATIGKEHLESWKNSKLLLEFADIL